MACNPYLGYTHFRLSSASDCTGFHSQYAGMALRFYSSKEQLQPTWEMSTTTCEVVIFRMDSSTIPIVRLEIEGTIGKVYQLECGWSQYTYTSVAMSIYMTASIQYKYCDISVCESTTAPTQSSSTTSTSTQFSPSTTTTTMTTESTTTTASTTTTTTTTTSTGGQTETVQDPCNPFDGTRYLRLSNCGPVYNADCNSRWEPSSVVAFGHLVDVASSSRPRDGELSAPKRITASSTWWHDWSVGLGCSCFQEAKYRNATLDLNLLGDFSVTSILITQGTSPIDNLCIDCLGENNWHSPTGTPAPPSASLQVKLSREKTIIQCDAAGCTATQERPVWQEPRCEAGSVSSSIEPFRSKLWSLLVLLYMAKS
ncbi:unnamed protein product [Cladocopium goreaui]|uniref:Uncharacterized protein n=1 Tax=Cladocopium goreaui TaxID=2562237 RepID=A0A9P1GD55_9DINO|nr:unnamed protein product [Cladocopium goreaui]